VNWKTTAVVAVLADWGAAQHGRIGGQEGPRCVPARHGRTPGTASCHAVYGVYRLLTVPKSALQKPYPTRAVIDVA
jgi:hypothetical protein